MERIAKKHADKIRFLIVGGLNTAIDFVILFILVKLFSLPVIYSNIISTSIALLFSFFANKKFTFKNNSKGNKTQPILFLIITLAGLWIIQPIIIYFTNLLLSPLFSNSDLILLIGKLIATCVTLIWNYLFYSRLIFKHKM